MSCRAAVFAAFHISKEEQGQKGDGVLQQLHVRSVP